MFEPNLCRSSPGSSYLMEVHTHTHTPSLLYVIVLWDTQYCSHLFISGAISATVCFGDIMRTWLDSTHGFSLCMTLVKAELANISASWTTATAKGTRIRCSPSVLIDTRPPIEPPYRPRPQHHVAASCLCRAAPDSSLRHPCCP